MNMEFGPVGQSALSASSRVPCPDDRFQSALDRLNGPLPRLAAIAERNLGHLPSLRSALVELSNKQDLPALRRGVLGEINTAIRLEKLGRAVHEISADVRGPDGRKFTDVDVLTRGGSAIEVRDHATTITRSGIAAKADRMCALRDQGLSVDGVQVRWLFLFAPGGVTPNARQYLEDRGITVLTSIRDLSKVT
jgi:hypothetical protein